MALPSIVMPATLPDWRVAPHEQTLPAPYAPVQFTTGQARMRRTSVGAATAQQAELLLTEAQALVLHNWFEDDLQAGVLPFAARVLSPAGGHEWWHARFAQPPVWECLATSGGPWWRVQAVLRLEGAPSNTAP